MLHHKGIEGVEDYQLGGFHLVSIGDCFAQKRYRVVHKLGYGGSSTVWLARDQEGPERLVTLKVMRADASSARTSEIPALIVDDHFVDQGPNGTRLFIAFPFAGPSVLAMSDCPGRTIGSRRALLMGVRNKLPVSGSQRYLMTETDFQISPHRTSHSPLRPTSSDGPDADLYAGLGEPETEEDRARGGTPCPPSAPAELQSIILGDFGQSYAVASPPRGYNPATVFNYVSPEARFEGRAGLEADVWAIFEIRTGRPLFESFFGSDADILNVFEERVAWFEEDGEPKSVEDQARAGVLLKASKSSIREQLRSVGVQDEAPSVHEGRMIEPSGVRLREEEVEPSGDLLGKMLKYRREERIKMEEVITHPWFNSTD
ncbi:hypothetical protein HETIRDRAFT_455646 [Heterobasidion irregulare TC 32-1]|uniref:non-specific serine/threonine protein kinase n=1 Tax=Heterobasidion irregulare (strain TC 32-1) TaxID=747525 RepID=W4JSG2_HETIT|nr:uncharacterized protein HETIRDRAFT_455646 [Heterobasidion irregulare TC 32-1]ETW76050.1 hypothetical protein HETIRDRAFT_455646 [Heterobasidion irregulare TC 32-1]